MRTSEPAARLMSKWTRSERIDDGAAGQSDTEASVGPASFIFAVPETPGRKDRRVTRVAIQGSFLDVAI